MIDELLKPVFAIFEAELREQSSEVADALMRSAEGTNASERRELMTSVYRYAHSMKGNAGTLGLEDLQELAHAMETLLLPYRSGEQALDRGHAGRLLALLDVCPARVAAVLSGTGPAAEDIHRATRELLALAEAGSASGGEVAARPADPPEPPSETEAPQSAAAIPSIGDATAPAPAAPAERPQQQPSPARNDERKPAPAPAVETVRVSIGRLQRLDRLLEDLRDARGALEMRVEDLRRVYWLLEEAISEQGADAVPDALRLARDQVRELVRGLALDVTEMSARTTNADEELRQLRMVPVETVVSPLPRAVWEHAERVKKRARLSVRGAEVSLDRRLLDELKDPLVHLVRNAVDHGLEAPEARRKVGKDEEGVLRLEVEQKGTRVLLMLSDDGRGIDVDAVRETAVRRGIISSDGARALDTAAVYELLFAPGFSTASEVSMTSGRGVGLDVVREKVTRIGGRVSIHSERGKGTTFTLELPLTLATAQALIVEAGGHQLAIPLAAIHSAHYTHAPGGRVQAQLLVEGQPLRIESLAAVLGLAEHEQLRTGAPVVVVRNGERLIALRVERLLGEREVVLKPLPPELSRLRHLTAAASVGDGRVVFVLQPRALGENTQEDSAAAARGPSDGVRRKRRILVADDSITTRSLHRQVLEAAGFEVDTASDGEDALRVLASGRSHDLVVSDVRMPRVDGLALTERIRRDERISALPVILVSSMDSDEDRRRTQDVGASAFLSKQQYERGELLRLVQSLLAS